VPFSIDKNFKDEIWCDMVPMGASCVLLGRTSQFDRGVMYDRKSNTYSFTNEHKKVTLTFPRYISLKKPSDGCFYDHTTQITIA